MFLLILYIVLVFLSFLKAAINKDKTDKIIWSIMGTLWFVCAVLDIVNCISE